VIENREDLLDHNKEDQIEILMTIEEDRAMIITGQEEEE
jgi:hypothetical protein